MRSTGRLFVCAYVFMSGFCSTLHAFEDVLPVTPDPIVRLAKINEDQSLTVLVSSLVSVPEERERTEEVVEVRRAYEQTDEGPKLVEVQEVVTRVVRYTLVTQQRVTQEFHAPSGSFKGYTIKGELIELDDLSTRLKTAKPVVISAERRDVIDPLYLELFNSKTILLVVDANLSPETASPETNPDAPLPPAEAAPAPPAN